MSDAITEPITLQAYNPGDLLMDANARTNAQATVTKADVALCKTIAASRPDGCDNNVPITIVRRPDGRLRVRTGHRRTIGCLRAGVWASQLTTAATAARTVSAAIAPRSHARPVSAG